MPRQFLVGGGVSLLTVAIHALVMTIIVRVSSGAEIKSHPFMIPTVTVLRTGWR